MSEEEKVLRALLDWQGLMFLNDGVYEPDGTLLFLTRLTGPDDPTINGWLPEVYLQHNYQSFVVFYDTLNWWPDPRPDVRGGTEVCSIEDVLTRGPDLRKLAKQGRKALEEKGDEQVRPHCP